MGLWVKICGITRPEDALAVEHAGADALGLVFAESSPRFVTIEQAEKICETVSSKIEKVAVIVNTDWKLIRQILDRVPVDMIQWHGNSLDREGAEMLAGCGVPLIHAVRWNGEDPLLVPPTAFRLLVEGRSDKALGGTGIAWDYSRIAEIAHPLPLILSGGLSPERIGPVLERVGNGLFGIDVSSGVEKMPGIKDSDKIMDFVKRARIWESQS